MQRIRNDNWKNDQDLRQSLERFVRRSYKRCEIVVSVKKQFSQYAWSISTLANRLKYFEIKYTNHETPLDDVYEAVSKEIEGPGSKLGYRAMAQKIREIHHLNVPRDVVYEVMKDIDPDGLEARGNVGQKKGRKRNKRFVSPVST